jgi:hypothetical protein
MDQSTSDHAQSNGNDLTAQQRHWFNHFQQCQNSGLSMAAYARSQGLQIKSFYYWRKRLLGQQAEQKDKRSEFHPVQITSPDVPIRQERISILLRLPNGVECELQSVEIRTGLEVLDKLARIRV